jgi:mRNA interferase RelE/StbE
MPYSLKLLRGIEKQLERIPKKQRERLVAAMRSLSVEPRPPGCIKLDERLFRIRTGQYRIIYAVFDNELLYLSVKLPEGQKPLIVTFESCWIGQIARFLMSEDQVLNITFDFQMYN